MQNTLSTKDFTNKISLRNRLKQLIIEQSIQSDVIARPKNKRQR